MAPVAQCECGFSAGEMVTNYHGRKGKSLKMLRRAALDKMLGGLAKHFQDVEDKALEVYNAAHPSTKEEWVSDGKLHVEHYLADREAGQVAERAVRNHNVTLKFENGKKEKYTLFDLTPHFMKYWLETPGNE